jgi:O-antigen/teichoic acid export membrane protein
MPGPQRIRPQGTFMPSSPDPSDSEALKSVPAVRRGLLKSTVWGWAGQLIFIAAGFLLPRTIDRTLGQELLGIWDFSWSIVAYFSLIEFGVSSSVNRFVAKHLAEDDPIGLNRSLSSVFCLQGLVGLVILIIASGVAWILPYFWGSGMDQYIAEARWLIFFLGFAIAAGFATGAFAGALTGCRRWDIYNLISAGGYAITVLAMIVCLHLTLSIKLLGVIYAAGTLVQSLGYFIAARRVCPAMRIDLSLVDRGTLAAMIGFGGKTFMNGLARSFLYQTSGIMMVAYMGPAALAVFNRPLALTNIVKSFATKFAHVLTPVASGLQAAGSRQTLQTLAVETGRIGAALALPPLLFLSILGGPVLLLWMGPGYSDNLLPLLLALGHLWAFANLPLQTILTGLNAHGGTAMVSVISSAGCAGICWLIISVFGGGLYSVAACIGITLFLTDGAYVSFFLSRRLGLQPLPFLREVWLRPLMCCIPFTAWLCLVRTVLTPPGAVMWGGAGGVVLLTAMYWHWILPVTIRQRIKARFASLRCRVAALRGSGSGS